MFRRWLANSGRTGFLRASPAETFGTRFISFISTARFSDAAAQAEVAPLDAATQVQGGVTDAEKPRYLKTKKLTKTAAHIMQILDREDVAEAKALRSVPELRPGDVVQLRVETPENKRRISSFRGIVMAIRRRGLQSTFRIRRFLAGVGVELLYPLYSPNIKELKVLEHRKVRRNKLYYIRDKMQDKKNKIT